MDGSLDAAVTPCPHPLGHPGMVGGVTFRAQALPTLRRKAEGRGSWVKLNSDSGAEELRTSSLLIGGSGCSHTLTESVSPG